MAEVVAELASGLGHVRHQHLQGYPEVEVSRFGLAVRSSTYHIGELAGRLGHIRHQRLHSDKS